MGIISWLVLGGVAGWLGSWVMGTRGKYSVRINIAVGIVGAFFGGWLFQLIGGRGITGFNIYSLLVATVGSAICIGILKSIKTG